MKPSTLFILSFLVAISIAAPAFSADKNGFDLSTSLVDTDQIFFGGPPKDGIPALTRPAFVSLDAATFLDDEDRVLGLSADGQPKAYPITILNWHEIVNDQVGSMEVAVTYCPLCGTGAAFLAQVDGETLEFGVSGLLYNSDVLLYDRTTESLWSQIRAQAVTGPLAGKALVQVPLIHTSWAKWKKKHPDTLVLSQDTGFVRDYDRNPYAGYANSEALYFPMEFLPDDSFHPKTTVLGVKIGSATKAYPFPLLERSGKKEFSDTIGPHQVTIRWDSGGYSASAESAAPPLTFIQGFWFAWYAFYPDTELFSLQ